MGLISYLDLAYVNTKQTNVIVTYRNMLYLVPFQGFVYFTIKALLLFLGSHHSVDHLSIYPLKYNPYWRCIVYMSLALAFCLTIMKHMSRECFTLKACCLHYVTGYTGVHVCTTGPQGNFKVQLIHCPNSFVHGLSEIK